MREVFPFLPGKGHGGEIVYRPFLYVTLKNGVKEAGLSALFDTGADNIVLNPSLARVLDVDLESGKKREVQVATGEVTGGYAHELEVTVVGEAIKCRVVFLDEEIPDFEPIIGRAGIFDNYRVIFEKNKTIIETFS